MGSNEAAVAHPDQADDMVLRFSVEQVAASMRLRRDPFNRVFLAFASIPLFFCAFILYALAHHSTGSLIAGLAVVVVPVGLVVVSGRFFGRRRRVKDAEHRLTEAGEFSPINMAMTPEWIDVIQGDRRLRMPWQAVDDWREAESVIFIASADVQFSLPTDQLSSETLDTLRIRLAEEAVSTDGSSVSAESEPVVAENSATVLHTVRFAIDHDLAARSIRHRVGRVSAPRLAQVGAPAIAVEAYLSGTWFFLAFLIVCGFSCAVIAAPIWIFQDRLSSRKNAPAHREVVASFSEHGCVVRTGTGVERSLPWDEMKVWVDDDGVVFVAQQGGQHQIFPVSDFPPEVGAFIRQELSQSDARRVSPSWRSHFRFSEPTVE